MWNQLSRLFLQSYIPKCKKTKNKENRFLRLQNCISLVKKSISKRNQKNLMNKERLSIHLNSLVIIKRTSKCWQYLWIHEGPLWLCIVIIFKYFCRFSPECCIICLVYINRLIAFTGLTLNPTNWRPLLLSSLLVAQKVWDDKYLSNADFAFIYPFFTT